MQGPNGQFGELRRLTDALWDEEITPPESARLEELVGASAAAKQCFLDYVHERAQREREQRGFAPPKLSALMGVEPPRRRLPLLGEASPRVYAGLATGLLVGVALGVMAISRMGTGGRGTDLSDGPATAGAAATPADGTGEARVSGTAEAQWSDGQAPPDDGRLVAGRALVLREGFAEIAFDKGARVILHAPAVFEPQSASGGFLREGRLTARVPPQAAGFVVRTPNATVVDLGTEFGVAVDPGGPSEVEVFAGQVEVSLPAGPQRTETRHRLQSKEALRIAPADAAGPAEVQRIAPGRRHFVCGLPTVAVTADLLAPEPGTADPGAAPVGPVARLQALIALDPHVIDYYPLAGATAKQQRRDRRGGLHLEEVAMCGGPAGGQVDYGPGGPDTLHQAVRPFRAGHQGNTHGAALQSQGTFVPPEAMTIELLLSYDGAGEKQAGSISVAVGTRASRRRCGFFVAAVDEGRLVHLLDAYAPWLETEYCFLPGHRYYLASSFQVADGQTIVNTYVANLSAGDRTLKHVLKDGLAAGTGATGRLGIGQGFDGELACAYPWPGELDEIAIYDAVLDRSILEAHLESLLE